MNDELKKEGREMEKAEEVKKVEDLKESEGAGASRGILKDVGYGALFVGLCGVAFVCFLILMGEEAEGAKGEEIMELLFVLKLVSLPMLFLCYHGMKEIGKRSERLREIGKKFFGIVGSEDMEDDKFND